MNLIHYCCSARSPINAKSTDNNHSSSGLEQEPPNAKEERNSQESQLNAEAAHPGTLRPDSDVHNSASLIEVEPEAPPEDKSALTDNPLPKRKKTKRKPKNKSGTEDPPSTSKKTCVNENMRPSKKHIPPHLSAQPAKGILKYKKSK